ncbi:hypothetical protein [Candidatus Proelusimicrobium volucris]|uniref:hypothetical protein n=1 Tax=Candidatus Proelusimicrobium volucris TaxID=3416225 RepID=UPI003D114387
MKDILDIGRNEVNLSGSGAGLYKVMLELLQRWETLAPMAKEFAVLDKALKKYFYGVPDFRIGKYQVKGFYCDSSKLRIPEKVKNKYLRKEREWIVSINKINK